MTTAPGPAASPSLQLRRSTAALAQSDGKLGWAPIVAALAIDLADLISAGPHGLVIGGVLTMAFALACGARLRRALGLGVLGALYCALPLTEPIPLATMLTLVHAFVLRTRTDQPAGRTLGPSAARVSERGGKAEHSESGSPA